MITDDMDFWTRLTTFATYQLPWVVIAFFLLRRIKMWDDGHQVRKRTDKIRKFLALVRRGGHGG